MGNLDNIKKLKVNIPTKNKELIIEINKMVTIGSEGCDVIIEDETVSPLHLCLFEQEDVLSIEDQGSKEGVFVNGEKIAPQKKYILDAENDYLLVGGVEIKFALFDEKTNVDKSVTLNLDNLILESKLDRDEQKAAESIQKIHKEKNKKNKKNQKKRAQELLSVPKRNVKADISIYMRFMSVGLDILFLILIFSIFSIDLSFMDIHLKHFIDMFLTMCKTDLQLSNKEMIHFIESDSLLKGVKYFVTYFVFRISFGMILGRSLGQFLLGLNTNDSFIMKRLKAFLRESFSLIFIPFFLVTDFPIILGRRSLKEIMSGTHYESPRFAVVFLLSIILYPVLMVAIFLAPIVENAKLFTPTPIVEDYKFIEDEDVYILGSESLGVYLKDNKDLKVVPFYNLRLKDKKKIIKGNVLLIHNDQTIEISKSKSINMVSLFESFTHNNPLGHLNFPLITSQVKNIALQNDNFKLQNMNTKGIIVESVDLLQWSLNYLSWQRAPELIEKGILPYSLSNFKDKFLDLYEIKPKSFKIININDQVGIYSEHEIAEGKTYYNFLTLGGLEGNLYRFSEDINLKIYQELRSSLSFKAKEFKQKTSALSSLDMLGKETLQVKQKILEQYFSTAQWALYNNNEDLMNSLQVKMFQYLEYLKLNSQKNKKFILNFSEILSSLKKRNEKYFSVKRKRVI